MSLPARAENVAVVRHALAGLAEEIGMDAPGVADLKTVVTEACMNVVVHAYEGEPGPLNVEAEPDADGLTVVVRDSGVGIRPRPEAEPSSLRLGLSLIAALSSSFSFSGGLDRGTEVEMHLPLQRRRRRGGRAARSGRGPRATPPRSSSAAPSCSARCWRGSSGSWPPAATFPSTASPTPSSSPTRSPPRRPAASPTAKVRLALADAEDGLELRLGPMADGGAEEIRKELGVPDVGGSLEALADELSVEGADDGDYLAIRFSSPAPAP